MLGKYYEKGVGTERNPELARQWYEKAAAQGDEKAVRYLRLSGVSAGEPGCRVGPVDRSQNA